MIMLGFAERAQASKQAKQNRRRLGREAEETRARSVASRDPSQANGGGRAGSLSIHVFAFYIFGRVVGRVPGVGLKNLRFQFQPPESAF
jgi:hypothetical protein